MNTGTAATRAAASEAWTPVLSAAGAQGRQLGEQILQVAHQVAVHALPTDYKEAAEGLTAAVIVCSDSIFAGKKEDKAGKAIITHLERYAIPATYTIIADEIADIQSNIKKAVDAGTSLVLITGGTGLT